MSVPTASARRAPGALSSGECAAVLRAMGDGTRLAILRVLFGGERSVSEICRKLGLEQHFASRHLAVLRNSRLVEARREAQRVYYRLHPSVRRRLGAGLESIDLGCCEVRFRQG